jgi:hypothetical protein
VERSDITTADRAQCVGLDSHHDLLAVCHAMLVTVRELWLEHQALCEEHERFAAEGQAALDRAFDGQPVHLIPSPAKGFAVSPAQQHSYLHYPPCGAARQR